MASLAKFFANLRCNSSLPGLLGIHPRRSRNLRGVMDAGSSTGMTTDVWPIPTKNSSGEPGHLTAIGHDRIASEMHISPL